VTDDDTIGEHMQPTHRCPPQTACNKPLFGIWEAKQKEAFINFRTEVCCHNNCFF